MHWLSVCFSENHRFLAFEKCHSECLLSEVSPACDTLIRLILQSSDVQEPLTCRRTTIQYP